MNFRFPFRFLPSNPEQGGRPAPHPCDSPPKLDESQEGWMNIPPVPKLYWVVIWKILNSFAWMDG